MTTYRLLDYPIQSVPLGDECVTDSLGDRIQSIQAAVGDGAVDDTIAYDVQEIAHHFHTTEHWYGKDGGDTFLVEDGFTAWQMTAGAGAAFGNWKQLSNGDEITTGPFYDPHKLLITQASSANKLYYLQLGTGNGGAQVAITTIVFWTEAALRQSAIEFRCPRLAKTVKLWARLASTQDAATASILLGLHIYPV